LISAWSFDDRAGVAVLLLTLKALKERSFSPLSPLIIAFTAHEEGGCYGARALALREKPEIFIAVDGCAIIDQTVLKLDGRPGIWSKDAVCNYDQRLIRDLLASASEAGTELQPVVYEKSFSDASAICQAGAAVRVAVLGHVCQNSHGGCQYSRMLCGQF
jgi:putative aminopeptidase FrvX